MRECTSRLPGACRKSINNSHKFDLRYRYHCHGEVGLRSPDFLTGVSLLVIVWCCRTLDVFFAALPGLSLLLRESLQLDRVTFRAREERSVDFCRRGGVGADLDILRIATVALPFLLGEQQMGRASSCPSTMISSLVVEVPLFPL